MTNVSYLIVGQGLAGSILAYTLHKKGQQILVVADSRPTSSAVAAGLFNPITGKKLVKTWQADALFAYLPRFYHQLEEELGQTFLHNHPLYRPFRSITEQNTYTALSAEPTLSSYLSTEVDHSQYSGYIHNELGGIATLATGWLDTQLLLREIRTYFQKLNIFREETFDYQDLKVQDERVYWKDIDAQTILFCEGISGVQNPYFSWLPFRSMKGEILRILVESPITNHLINQGVWFVPQLDGSVKIGATYDWQDTSWLPTPKGEAYLTEQVKKFLKVPFTIQERYAGIRPATADRRAFVGIHPTLRQVGIFNGMGSKGVSMIPYLANHFAEFLLYKKELNPEVNIERYFSLYFK
ncbi:MAG: FAD-dependent oxidoreductase [Spirosomataceae bacterium]